MCNVLADEVRRVMMETIMPTLFGGVKRLKFKTTKEDCQVFLCFYLPTTTDNIHCSKNLNCLHKGSEIW